MSLADSERPLGSATPRRFRHLAYYRISCSPGRSHQEVDSLPRSCDQLLAPSNHHRLNLCALHNPTNSDLSSSSNLGADFSAEHLGMRPVEHSDVSSANGEDEFSLPEDALRNVSLSSDSTIDSLLSLGEQ